MLTRVADGVHVHESACIQTNTIVVESDAGVLVIDPGLTEAELECLVRDIAGLGKPVVAGFSTHPDWDHVLWHPSLGDVPRYATARGAAFMREFRQRPGWQAEAEEGLPEEIAGQVPLELFGLLTALPAGATELPWGGPAVRILEHAGHAAGHAALLVVDARVLVAGDMLSDVLVPMPDLWGSDPDPLGEYLSGLELLESVVHGVDVVVPGHGSAGMEAGARIHLDRAYIEALRDGATISDPRVDRPRPGWEWVGEYIHAGNVEAAARAE